MHDYLFLALGPGGAPIGDLTLAFDDEVDAIRHALGPAFPHGCDLWRDYRLLGRFCGPASSQADNSTPAIAA